MSQITERQKLINEVKLRLGAGMIDIELDPEHYNLALDMALGRYRQRSGNALEESFIFLDVQPDVATYTLPSEVQEVRAVYRRSIGGGAGGSFDPFSQGWVNGMYQMMNPGGLGGGGAGSLALYDAAAQYQETVGRLFGRDVMYVWDAATKRISFQRRFGAVEQIALHVFNAKPECVLLIDVYARRWLFDCTVAHSKQMLGEARGMFGNIAGPQGGITLNGDALKSEAQAEIERLDTEITQFFEQHAGWPFIIG